MPRPYQDALLLFLLFGTIDVIQSLSFDDYCSGGRTTAGPSDTVNTAKAQVYTTYDFLSQPPMPSLGTCLILDEMVDEFGEDGVARNMVAIDSDVFDNGMTCGSCLELAVGGKTAVVKVFERHNGVGTHDVGVPLKVSKKLQRSNAAKNTDFYAPFEVQWKFVPCTAYSSSNNLLYRFSDDANLENVPAIKVTNEPYGIQRLHVEREGTWYELGRQVGSTAYWVLPQGLQVLPMKVKVQSFTNEVVEFMVEELNGSKELKDTGVQFSGDCYVDEDTKVVATPPPTTKDEPDDTSSGGSPSDESPSDESPSNGSSSISNTTVPEDGETVFVKKDDNEEDDAPSGNKAGRFNPDGEPWYVRGASNADALAKLWHVVSLTATVVIFLVSN